MRIIAEYHYVYSTLQLCWDYRAHRSTYIYCIQRSLFCSKNSPRSPSPYYKNTFSHQQYCDIIVHAAFIRYFSDIFHRIIILVSISLLPFHFFLFLSHFASPLYLLLIHIFSLQWHRIVPWRSVHLKNCPLWHLVPVTFLHLSNPSRYISSTSSSRWMFCHMWHDIHRLLLALWYIYDALLAVNRNVDSLSQVFRTHLWFPTSCLAKCRLLTHDLLRHYIPLAIVKCGLIYTLAEPCSIIALIHSSLRIICHTETKCKCGTMLQFSRKMDVILCWNKMSQHFGQKILGRNITALG